MSQYSRIAKLHQPRLLTLDLAAFVAVCTQDVPYRVYWHRLPPKTTSRRVGARKLHVVFGGVNRYQNHTSRSQPHNSKHSSMRKGGRQAPD
jgi:hypothetical protein